MVEGLIDFSEWLKLDLRVAEIKSIEEIDGADKLYKLEVDIGEELRTLLAGLKPYYKKQELKGKKCIIFTNLKTRKIKGIESQGMILAAVSEDKSQVILIQPEKDIENGSRIS